MSQIVQDYFEFAKDYEAVLNKALENAEFADNEVAVHFVTQQMKNWEAYGAKAFLSKKQYDWLIALTQI